ncbi:MAG: L,D-transpeptidase family protein [Sphingomonas sp.]|nr:L,D-transpeptidase family protein [Sphingomonas sp.]
MSAAALALVGAKSSVHATADARAAAPHPAQSGNRLFLTKTQLDQAIASGTLDRPIRSLLAVKAPLQFGDYSWDDRGAAPGPTWIRVDLGSQLISVFRGGDEIGTAVIVYGGDNKETPAGKLQILGKARDHRSSLYDAEMPYTLRLTDDGVSIHASSVRWGAATHGCIGVPLPFAKRLFDAARVGDEVVIVGTPPRMVGQRAA